MENETFYIGKHSYSTGESTLLCTRDNIFSKERLYRTQKGAFFVVEEGLAPMAKVLTKAAARAFMDENAGGIHKANYDAIFGRPEPG